MLGFVFDVWEETRKEVFLVPVYQRAWSPAWERPTSRRVTSSMVRSWNWLPFRQSNKGNKIDVQLIACLLAPSPNYSFRVGNFLAKICSWMDQNEVLERAEGIKKEYNELDTVWFMAGSLFQVMPLCTLDYGEPLDDGRIIAFVESCGWFFKLFFYLEICSNTHMIFQLKHFPLRFSNKPLLQFSHVWYICR